MSDKAGENLYDNRGVRHRTIVQDPRTVRIDAARKFLTQMDIELMEPEPDADKLELLSLAIVDELYYGFSQLCERN